MLAEAVEVDVLDDHHLVIIDREQRVVQNLIDVRVVSAGQELGAFSTRFGVSRSPSRSGSSPSSASSFLIRSCMSLFYISALAAQSPDALYADRANLPSARQAAQTWARVLKANPGDFETAWKLPEPTTGSAAAFPESERRVFFEQGIDAGRKAAALAPNRPEGHFWTAANMGAMANRSGCAGWNQRRSKRSSKRYCASIRRFRTVPRIARRTLVPQGSIAVWRQPQRG